MTYKFPEYLKYADTHEYVKEENGLLRIGVSEFAIDQLGDIVFIELAEKVISSIKEILSEQSNLLKQ